MAHGLNAINEVETEKTVIYLLKHLLCAAPFLNLLASNDTIALVEGALYKTLPKCCW